MATIDAVFYRLAVLAGISFVVLAIGGVIAWRLRRPIERLRCIEATLIAVVAACLLQQCSLLPQITLRLLPQNAPGAPTAAIAQAETHPENFTRLDSARPAEFDRPIAGRVAAHSTATANVAQTKPSGRIASAPIELSPTDVQATFFSWIRCAFVLAFFAGAGWSLLQFAIGLLRLRRLTSECEPAPEGIARLFGDMQSPDRRRVLILSSPQIDIPMTFGLRTPKIVLPEPMVRTAPSAEIRYCVAHEWSHIRNRDIVVWWAVQLLQPLVWFQPLYWYLRRELRLAQDQVADHFAAARATDPTAYAEVLLDLAKQHCGIRPSLALTMNDGRSKLFRRIQLLLSPQQRFVAACRWWAIGTIAGILIVVAGILGTINIGRAVASAASGSPATPSAEEAPPALRAAAGNDDPSKAVIIGTVVDQAGNPVASAKIVAAQWGHPDAKAVTATDGQFKLQLDRPMGNFKMVYATSSDGKLLGRSQTAYMEFGRIVSRRIVLKPAVEMHIKVVNAKGAAVPGAIVAIDDSEIYMAAYGVSDSTGAATLHVPADAKVRVVVGFKSGVGCDYFENYISSESDIGPVPTEVKLVLDGARTVRMRATDSAGRPLAGIPFAPALMSKRGKIAFVVNTCFLCRLKDSGVLPRSGKDGIATCDWFPLALKRAIPFDPIDFRYCCPASPYCDEAPDGVVQPAEMLRVVKVSGRVTAADGTPAAGILVQAEGRGDTNLYCREYARTSADGTYSMDVYPRQQYIFAVVDPDRAAASITGVTMHQNQPRSGLDFRLVRGTLVEGRVTFGSKAEPIAGETVSVVTVGPTLPKSLMLEIKGQAAQLCRWADTDANGRYKIRLGPGNYQIAAPDWKYHDFTVGNESTVTRDYHLPRLPRGQIDVIVHNADGSPAADVTLDSNAFRGGRTDSGGRFHSERSQVAALLYAVDSAGRNAAIAALGPNDKNAELIMHPAMVAIGRSVGADGRPRANCFISAVIRMAGGADAPTVHQTACAKSDGSFRLTGLVDGTQCDVYVCTSMRCGISPAKKITIHGSGPIDLGDLPIPADEK